MQALAIIVFVVAMVMDFLTTSLAALPGVFKFTPEFLSILVTLIVMFRALGGGLSNVPPKYWFVFGSMAFVLVCGILTNSVGTGPILAGLRYDLRALPMFLLPAVSRFTEEQTRRQLKVMLGLALMQVPVAIYQRWVIISQGRFTGDDVRGTVGDSGVLSIFLICVAVVLAALYVRNHIRKWPFFILFFALLFPTTINETKATVVFLPIGLIASILIASPPGKRTKVFLGAGALLAAFSAILFPVYAAMNASSPYKDDKSLLDFYTNQQQVGNYIGDKKEVGFGTKRLVGRGTAITFPLKYLAQDPVHLAFGLGVGNASHSNLGEAFTGEYYNLFQNFVVSAAAAFLIELGLLGTLLIFLLYWLVFSDTLAVAKYDPGLMGAIAAGWVGVVGVMAIASFYNVTHAWVSLSYLYWYFAGVVAARRGQLAALAGQQSGAGYLTRAAS